jgi:threonyl-tRNA synthetase
VQRLREAGARAELDDRSESVARKIRDAELRKIPYMLVVGDREVEDDQVALREHGQGDAGKLSVAAFSERLGDEMKNRLRR